MNEQNTSAIILTLEKRLRQCHSVEAGAYAFASGLAQLLRLDDVYVALPTRGGRLRLAASRSHPVVRHLSVSIQWLQRLIAKEQEPYRAVSLDDVDGDADVKQPFAKHLFISQFAYAQWPSPTGGLIGFRDTPLTDAECVILSHFGDVWGQFYLAQRTLNRGPLARAKDFGIRRMGLISALVILPLLLLKTPMSVVAPAEIDSREISVAAPLFAGVIERIEVRPNQPVQQGDILAHIDSESLERERLVMALELQQRAAERTSLAYQGLNDPSRSLRYVTLEHEIELLQARLDYLDYQVAESVIVAARDGVVILTAENEVERRPVDAGQEIMRIVSPVSLLGRVYLPANNLIPLDPQQRVVLNLDKNIFNKYELPVDFIRPEPIVHDTLGLVYELYFSIPTALSGAEISFGDLGKARVYGPKATLLYQVFRRPWLSLRGWML